METVYKQHVFNKEFIFILILILFFFHIEETAFSPAEGMPKKTSKSLIIFLNYRNREIVSKTF